MVRSLIREAQIRDVDNMSETEHDAWVHVDLVTSGTVDFQDGTISGTGAIYADALYSAGEAMYTQSEVDVLITTLSGALQAQIDLTLQV
jgi:hypothetical protein